MKKMFLALALFNAGCLVANNNPQQGTSFENKSRLFDCVGSICTTTVFGGVIGGATGATFSSSFIKSPESMGWMSPRLRELLRQVPARELFVGSSKLGAQSFAAGFFVVALTHEFLNAGWKNRY